MSVYVMEEENKPASEEPQADTPETPEKENEGEDTSSDYLTKVKAENDRKAELLAKEEALLKRREKLEGDILLGGGSPAGGMARREESKEDKIKKEAAEMFAGTGVDKAIAKYG